MAVHGLLTPQNCTVIFIDHQPQMAFGVQSHDRGLILNNTLGLAKLGTGTLNLAATNTYTGGTVLHAGTLGDAGLTLRGSGAEHAGRALAAGRREPTRIRLRRNRSPSRVHW